jgi:hypothetical protein
LWTIARRIAAFAERPLAARPARATIAVARTFSAATTRIAIARTLALPVPLAPLRVWPAVACYLSAFARAIIARMRGIAWSTAWPAIVAAAMIALPIALRLRRGRRGRGLALTFPSGDGLRGAFDGLAFRRRSTSRAWRALRPFSPPPATAATPTLRISAWRGARLLAPDRGYAGIARSGFGGGIGLGWRSTPGARLTFWRYGRDCGAWCWRAIGTRSFAPTTAPTAFARLIACW